MNTLSFPFLNFVFIEREYGRCIMVYQLGHYLGELAQWNGYPRNFRSFFLVFSPAISEDMYMSYN